MTTIPINQFAERLTEILPVMMREFLKRQVQELCQGKITMPQFLVMEYVHKHKEITMGDLASFMQVSMATTSGIVDRLVRDGYLKRLPDPKDRRVIQVRLSTKGDGLLSRILKRRKDMICQTFGRISEDDRAEYLRILTQIRDILTTESK